MKKAIFRLCVPALLLFVITLTIAISPNFRSNGDQLDFYEDIVVEPNTILDATDEVTEEEMVEDIIQDISNRESLIEIDEDITAIPIEPEPQGVADYMIYGGTGLNGHLFSYNSTTKTFSDKGAPFVTSPWQIILDLTVDKDGKVYGITQYNGTFFIYDPITDSITSKGNVWSGGYRGSALTTGLDNKIYGGIDGKSDGTVHFFIYDPATDIITKKENFNLKSPSIRDLTTGLDGKIYGGTGGGTALPNDAHLFYYDIITDSFSDVYNFGSDRPVNALTTANDGKIYGTFGGFVNGYNFFIYDPSIDNMTIKNFPTKIIPMGDSLIEGLDGKIYGGASNLTAGGNGLFMYDPSTDIFYYEVGLWKAPLDLVTAPDDKIYFGTNLMSTPIHLFSYDTPLGSFKDEGEVIPGEMVMYSITLFYEDDPTHISPPLILRINATGTDITTPSGQVIKPDITLTWIDSPLIPDGDEKIEICKSTTPTDFDFSSCDITVDPGEIQTWTDFDANNPDSPNYNPEYYYTIRSVRKSDEAKSETTYSVGKFTKEFTGGSTEFALPLEIDDYYRSRLSWYCSDIPTAVGLSYFIKGVWKFHACEMPPGVYDTNVSLGKGYQLSKDPETIYYTFVGNPANSIVFKESAEFSIEHLNYFAKNVSLEKSGNDLILKWNYLGSIVDYNIYRSETRRERGLLVATVVGNTWTDVNADNPSHSNFWKEYYYRVVPINSSGEEESSSYSVGKWTKTFKPEKINYEFMDTLSLPLRENETKLLSWYCSDIQNCQDIMYIDETGHWKSYKTQDKNMVLGETYQLYFTDGSDVHYTFIGGVTSDTDTSGKKGMIYGGTSHNAQQEGHLFSYDIATDTMTDIGVPIPGEMYVGTLTTGIDGKIYGGTSKWPQSGSHLFIYDPVTNTTIDKGNPVPGDYIDSLTTGLDGRIYGGTLDGLFNAHFFIYDPVSDSIIDKGTPIPGARRILSLTTGLDGKIYGGTTNSHLFIYDPITDNFIDKGMPVPGAYIWVLTTGNDGRVYGGTGSLTLGNAHLFIYDPINDSVIDKGEPLPTEYAIYSLTTGNDGRVYGGTSTYFFIYDPITDIFINKGDPGPEIYWMITLVTGRDGKIYGGSSYNAHLFVYDPIADKFTDKGQPVIGEIEIDSLTAI
jgi:hypothetical protein